MEEFFTWELLSTLAGASAAVSLITQVAKHYLTLEPKVIALITSALIQLGVQVFYRTDLSPQGLVLAVLNVFVVLAASVGLFELIGKPLASRKKDRRI